MASGFSLFSFSSLLLVLISAFSGDAATCPGEGWVNRNNQKCLKLISDLLSKEDAIERCSEEYIPGDIARPTLLQVNTATEQVFLTHYVFNESNSQVGVWLGANRVNSTQEFLWDDGYTIEYANWAPDSPSENVARTCIEMDSGLSRANAGQWRDVTCIKGNWVVCQKIPNWSVPDMINSLIKLEQWKEEVSQQIKSNSN